MEGTTPQAPPVPVVDEDAGTGDPPAQVFTLPGSVYRPRGKETHYGRTEEVDPYDVAADWEERA